MAILYVGSSQTYQTVDDAVKAASIGDTIIIKGSEYTLTDERVTVNKSLTIKAEGDVTMRGLNIGGTNFDLVVDGINFVANKADANPSVTGFTNNASCISQVGQLRNVTIENCSFDISNAGTTQTYGIYLSLGTWGFENLVVRNNECNGYYNEESYSGYGLIYAANVQDADISNNNITYAASHAIQLSLTGTTYQGSGEQTVKINGNTVDKSYACAVYCADLHNSDMTVEINNNVITNVQEGSCSIYHGAIRIGQTTISGVEITGNVIEGAQVGIYNAAAIKEGSGGSIVISDNAIAISQLHPAEEGVTPECNGFGGTSIPENTIDNNYVIEGTSFSVNTNTDTIYVNNNWGDFAAGTKVVVNGKLFEYGTNAFNNINEAATAAEISTGKLVVVEGSNVTYTANQWFLLNAPQAEIEPDKWNYDFVDNESKTYDLQVDGTLGAYQILLNNSKTTVSSTGRLFANSETLRVMGGTFTVEGNRAANADAPEEIFTGSWGAGTKPGVDTQVKAGYLQINQGAVANFNNTVVFVNAGWMNFDNATADFSNTYIYLGSGGSYAPIAVQVANGAKVTLADNTTIINDTEFTMNITVDAQSTLTIDTSSTIVATTLDIAQGGKFIINATDFTGVKKVVDLSSTESLEGKVTIDGKGVNVIYGADGDITLVNVDTSTLYVNPDFVGDYGADLGNGKYMGINAFSTTKDAYMAARNLGGEITIDLTEAGVESLDGTIGFGNASKNGVYTITGGNGRNTTSYGISTANTDITVKFENAAFRIAKAYFANSDSKLFVNNSVIGTAAYAGHSGGWFTAGTGTISITNSIFGINYNNFTDEQIDEMARSASDVKAGILDGSYNYWASGNNNNGFHMGTAGSITVTDSTMSATWVSIVDRGLVSLDNSVMYYGAAISIGAGQVDSSLGNYDSNEIGWDSQIWWNPVLSSNDGFREGKVATLDIKNSIVKNIGAGNGNAGAHIQVGGSYKNGITQATGECSGELNLTNSELHTSVYDSNGNVIAKEYDMLVIKSNGTVNMSNSKLVSAKVINEGAFNVTGESTLQIDTLNSNGTVNMSNSKLVSEKVINEGTFNVTGESTLQIGTLTGTVTFDDASLAESSINKGSVCIKGENSYSGDFNVTYAFIGDWNNEKYNGSINFGTDSSVNVNGQMIIGYDTTVAGSNNVVFGDTTGAVKTDKVFKAADISVRRDGTLTIANTTGENKISTMNVMGSVIIDNATLSGEVQIGGSTNGEVTVKNGAVYNLGGSSNSVVVLGKSTKGTLNVDNATVTIKRCGPGAGYKYAAETFTIGYNGGIGILNLTNKATFTTSSGKTYDTSVEVSDVSSVNISGDSTMTVAGTFTNNGLAKINDSTFSANTIANNGTINIVDSILTANTLTNSSIVIVNGGTLSLANAIQNNGTITFANTVNGNITIEGTGSTTLNDKAVIADSLKANIAINGVAALDEDATFTGEIASGALKIDGSTNTLDITNSNNATLVIGNNAVISSDDQISDIAIKGETKQSILTIDAANLAGNKISDIVLNITNIAAVTEEIEINADFNLAILNSVTVDGIEYQVKSFAGKFYGNAKETDYNLYLTKVDGGIDISSAASNAGETTTLLEDQKSFNITDSADLGDAAIEMKKGTTTVTIKKDIDFTIGDIQKSDEGGLNNVSIGNNAKLTVNGTIDSFNNLTVGKESTVVVKEELIGTAGNQTIKLGNNSTGTFADIDLAGGNNTITLGKEAELEADSIDNITKLTLGNDATATVKDVYGTAKNNTISVGKAASLTLENDINLAEGKDTLKIDKSANLTASNLSGIETITFGSGSNVEISDTVSGVNKLTIANNLKNSTSTIELNDVEFTDAKAKLTIGKLNNVTAGDITFGNNNDTLKIDNDSYVVAQDVIFGEGKDALELGKNATFEVTNISGISTLKAKDNSLLIVKNGTDDVIFADTMKGNWSKLTIYDYQGDITEGTITGNVYSNEYDTFKLDLADGQFFIIGNWSDSTDIFISKFDETTQTWSEWSADVTNHEIGSILLDQAGKYAFSVAVSDSMFGKDALEKESYSFDAKLLA